MNTALAATASPQIALAELLHESKTSHIVVWPSDEAYRFGRIGRFDLFTNEHGDYLLTSAGLEPTEVMHVREFSLNGYDLATSAGRAAAREYVRRKLKAARHRLEAIEPQCP